MYFDVIRREKGKESSLELEIWGCKLDFGFVFWGVQGTRCDMIGRYDVCAANDNNK